MTETEFDQSYDATIISGDQCKVMINDPEEVNDAAIEYSEQHVGYLETRHESIIDHPPRLKVTVEVFDPRTGLTDRTTSVQDVNFVFSSNGLVILGLCVPSDGRSGDIYGVLVYCEPGIERSFKPAQAVVLYKGGIDDDPFIQAAQTFAMLHRRCMKEA